MLVSIFFKENFDPNNLDKLNKQVPKFLLLTKIESSELDLNTIKKIAKTHFRKRFSKLKEEQIFSLLRSIEGYSKFQEEVKKSFDLSRKKPLSEEAIQSIKTVCKLYHQKADSQLFFLILKNSTFYSQNKKFIERQTNLDHPLELKLKVGKMIKSSNINLNRLKKTTKTHYKKSISQLEASELSFILKVLKFYKENKIQTKLKKFEEILQKLSEKQFSNYIFFSKEIEKGDLIIKEIDQIPGQELKKQFAYQILRPFKREVRQIA